MLAIIGDLSNLFLYFFTMFNIFYKTLYLLDFDDNKQIKFQTARLNFDIFADKFWNETSITDLFLL